MATARRAAPPVAREEGVLILDASRAPDVDALHAQALELLLRRAGVRTLCLAFDFEPGRLARALETLTPRVVLLTGHRASLDALGRLVYVARRIGDRRGRLRLPRRAAGDRRVRPCPASGRGPPRAARDSDHRAPGRARGANREALRSSA